MHEDPTPADIRADQDRKNRENNRPCSASGMPTSRGQFNWASWTGKWAW